MYAISCFKSHITSSWCKTLFVCFEHLESVILQTFRLFKLSKCIIQASTTYRKVASSRPVYYSIFDYFLGATNWDVLLTETCHYYHVQQSIKWWVQKRSHYLQITSKYSHLPWLVFYFCILHLTKRSKILWLIILIFLQMQFHK